MNTLSNKVLLKMINYFNGDVVRINHALKVLTFSKIIGEAEELEEKELLILELSAILHDIGIKVSEKKYNSSAGNYQEIEGPAVAKSLLEDFKLEPKTLDRILFLIGHHHSYSKIDALDFQILVEADFLVNIFEDSLTENSTMHIRTKYFKTKTGTNLLDSMYIKK